jgi:drug/metabolite transporter (DMT)-like permease
MATAIALIILRATGWWDLFDSSKSVSDWPWYNFLVLLLGGGFASYLMYHAIKHLGDRG